MIAYDSTESRQGTRLPDSVLQAGKSVTGLEAATGADLLISTLTAPQLPAKLDPESRPHQVALGKHIASGMLVQRKSSRDLTGSIPELSGILRRMLDTHCELCWLLITGDIGCNREGECIIDSKPTGYSYAAVTGALDYWQLRGGYVTVLHRDNLIPSWLNGWLTRLADIQREPTKQIIRRLPQQVLTGPNWIDVLVSLPGVGPERAQSIAAVCDNLSQALCLLTDPAMTVKVEGVGRGTIASVRRVMGLRDGNLLTENSYLEQESE